MALNYTRQQMEGGVRYVPRVLLGNWNEDKCVEETILKDFLAKKEGGCLKIDRFQARMATALAPVELTVKRADGYVHFGDVIQLEHCSTGARLSADTKDVDRRTGEHACAATAATQAPTPCARNTFLLAKFEPPTNDASTMRYSDDVLRYGQKIRLVANPQILGQPIDAGGGAVPLCLFSKPVSTTHYAKYSHHQAAGFTTRSGFETVFSVVSPDPAKRLASEGVEVMAGVPIALLHCATACLLCLEPDAYPNDFGTEREVSFHNTKGNSKKMMLIHEMHGNLTATIAKAETQQNFWRFLLGTTVAELPPSRSLAFEANDILTRINSELARSPLGFSGFRIKLLRMDTAGSGKVLLDELMLAFNYAGIQVNMPEIAILGSHFQMEQEGSVDARAILGQMQMLDTNSNDTQ